MRESAIIHEVGRYWVCRVPGAYQVMRTGSAVSTCESAYPRTDDGKSIAIARADYLAQKELPK